MSQTRIAFVDLVALLKPIFLRYGTSEEVAQILAINCALCERDGATSHGIFRMRGYVDSLSTGWVDGKAIPVIEDVAPAFLRVDARNGFAQPALAMARDVLVEKTLKNGIALLAIRHSHHLSALWPDLEPFAEQGFLALSMVNSFACTVPHGGHSAVFGTNPIAFAVPTASGTPLVFDMATSSMANGDVQIAARENRLLPEGSGLDDAGLPTQDPKKILNGGALLPFGGHKGSSISMMVELLGAALTGGHYSFEFDWSGHAGAATPHTGQLIILINAKHSGGAPFGHRAEVLVDQMKSAGVTRLPGEHRHRTRLETDRNGIPITPEELAGLSQL
ncbi:Ldh family oxidoreductase [Pelagibacterium luteolum]|uniref:Delta(1)-pyrroline-2-carboxylate/Delta(1)-piperideine-2-carboxylate reductase n=1 Tax=Pelagibacterium luteolum TaxID=440168 RepID=A0A1G7S4U2_9HYPH|nr:Ldh family oxidoreductase [Pelagibacterium luteolum]SDG18001.1 delta1-piperideine-2-carboxylate reductase [Pelagibacterium luteolum]